VAPRGAFSERAGLVRLLLRNSDVEAFGHPLILGRHALDFQRFFVGG
jgi:hypothetical protein